MISQTAEYALRAIVFLAAQNRATTTELISKGTKVPTGYLAKIMQNLTRADIVISQRGLHGGFKLSRDPHDIMLYDVIEVFAPITRIHECPLGFTDHKHHLCPLHQNLDDCAKEVEDRTKNTSVGKLIEDRENSSVPLCVFPYTIPDKENKE